MSKKLLPVALATLGMMGALTAKAEGVEYHGYFRTQAGGTTKGGNLQCFQPSWPASGAGDRAVGRLGNECDNYGEATVGLGFGDQNGVWGKYKLGMSYKPQQATSYEQAGSGMEFANRQNYFEAGGFFPSGAMEDSTLWVGKRYYNRHDIHIMDQYYLDNSGTGGGIEGIKVGKTKVAAAYLQGGVANGHALNDVATKRYALRVYDIAVNEGGKFESELTMIRGSTAGTTPVGSGHTLSVQHTQDKVMGGFNKLALVLGKDTGAGFTWTPQYSGGGTGDDGKKSWRLHEQFFFDLKGTRWTGMVAGSAGKISAPSAADTSFWDVVVRPQYNFTQNFSVAVEMGHAQGKQGANKPSMTKLTVAPQLALSQGFWARPVLRAFVTHATWNEDAGTVANGVFGTARSGTTFGVQAEAWW